MIAMNKTNYFPYTPATNILFGLAESIDMLRFLEHGFDVRVFANEVDARLWLRQGPG